MSWFWLVSGVMATCFFQDDSVQPCGLPLGALLTFDEARGRWVIKKTIGGFGKS